MTRATMRSLTAFGIALLFAAPAVAQDYVQDYNEDTVDATDIPKAVQSAATKAVPKARFTQYYKDNEKRFRFVGKQADGRTAVVLLDNDGKLASVSVRGPVTTRQVPKAVSKALDVQMRKDRQLNGFTAEKVFRAEVNRPNRTEAKDKEAVLYQFEGRNADGLQLRASIREDGTPEPVESMLAHPDADKVEKTIPLAQLPPEMKQGALAAAPGVRFYKAVEETPRGGVTACYLYGRDPKGRPVKMDISPNGNVIWVQTDIAAREVPMPAMELMAHQVDQDAALQGFKPQRAQRVELKALPGGEGLVFVFLGKNAKGEPHEIRVGPDENQVTSSPASEKDLKLPTDGPAAKGDADDDARPKAKSKKRATRGARSKGSS